jgi:4-hydroxy-tetrahydrodipicolinate synthase
MAEFHGVIVPMITPFDVDGELDLQGLHDQIDALIAGGVHGLIPAGSTGEAMSLRPDEYRTVVAETINHVRRRVPVIAGCSANATRDVIANCQQAARLGADGLMTVHPFYSLPDHKELFDHYRSVAENISLPLMIYNNPFTTGVDATPELLIALSRSPHIDYVKESSGDVSRILRILLASEGRLAVLCGSDHMALESFAAGATGWVAGIANSIPEQCVALYGEAVQRARYVEARGLYERIHSLATLAEATGKFVQVNKAAVEMVGRRAGAPRAPLGALSDELRNELRTALAAARSAQPLAAVEGR